jgi:drug/metabolite transporter (DMT)-like permease
VLAALGVAVNQALFLAGLKLTPPFVASLVGATIPVFASAIAVLCRKEAGTWRTGLGIALALSGVLWLTGVGSGALSPSTRADGSGLGAAILSLNCLSYATYVVFSRDVVREIGSFRLMAWVFTYGALMFAPLGMRGLLTPLPAITTRGWMFLAYLDLVPTILAVWAQRLGARANDGVRRHDLRLYPAAPRTGAAR